MKHITNINRGHGLVKADRDFVLFERKFLKDTKLNKLMATKVGK